MGRAIHPIFSSSFEHRPNLFLLGVSLEKLRKVLSSTDGGTSLSISCHCTPLLSCYHWIHCTSNQVIMHPAPLSSSHLRIYYALHLYHALNLYHDHALCTFINIMCSVPLSLSYTAPLSLSCTAVSSVLTVYMSWPRQSNRVIGRILWYTWCLRLGIVFYQYCSSTVSYTHLTLPTICSV